MTKLPPEGELIIRQLDDLDDAADADVQAKWLEREPYLARGRWLRSALRELRDAVASLASIVPHQRVTLGQIRRSGLLDRLVQPQRKRPPWHSLDLAVADVHRVRDIWKRGGQKRQRRDDKTTAGLVAAERHLRLTCGWCSVGQLGEGEEGEVELCELEAKLHSRMRSMGGTTGAERNKRKVKRE